MFDGIDFPQTLIAARQGDSAALNTLLTRCYPAVRDAVHRSLATSTRRNRPWLSALFSTGDVVQEVFVSVVKDIDSLNGVSEKSLLGFLTSMVRNRLVDSIRFHEAMRRGARSSRSLDRNDVDEAGRQPPEAAVRAEEIETFCRILASIPARERTLLVDRLQHEHTFGRLAADLGFPSADAARKAFYVAQARLLVRLGQAGLAARGRS